jgi:hypothetical protein
MYLGRQLSIELLSEKLGDQIIGDGLVLQGFSFDSRRPDADLLIEGGDPSEPLFVHYVHRPTNVWVAETELGEEADIQVESADHSFTLVRLRRLPALPPAGSGRRRKSPKRAPSSSTKKSPTKKASKGRAAPKSKPQKKHGVKKKARGRSGRSS